MRLRSMGCLGFAGLLWATTFTLGCDSSNSKPNGGTGTERRAG
jgi:hypothetical protein